MDGWCIVLPSALPAVWIFQPDEAEHHLSDDPYLPVALSSDESGIVFRGDWYDTIDPCDLEHFAVRREEQWMGDFVPSPPPLPPGMWLGTGLEMLSDSEETIEYD